MSSRTTSVLTVAGITALGLVAYAVYFDYKRRNDVNFRKKLKKDKKRVDKSIASSKASMSPDPGAITDDELREALEQVKAEQVPVAPDQKENYFMTQVASGEQLSLQGPMFHLPAALAFYRALRVYPSPVELMMIYQKTVPEPIFKLVIQLTNLDVKDRVEGYYLNFPPKSFGVKIETHKIGDVSKKTLVLTKDVKAGEVIYQEFPLVAALDSDLQAAGTYCTQCLRAVEPSMSIKSPESPAFEAVYCSAACQIAAKSRYHSLLFTLDRPLPPHIPMEDVTPDKLEERRKAHTQYADYLKTKANGHAAPLLVARFIARQVALEMNKLIPDTSSDSAASAFPDYTDADGGDYLLADHFERLRYVEVTPPKEELELLTNVLETVLPGLNSFVTDERYATLVAKMAYNAFGVYYDGGRADKPAGSARPEDIERTRAPVGTSRQVGSAVYTVSSYLAHSCDPNARPEFPAGTSNLHLVATRDLKTGEELTVAYVDVIQHEGESVADCRRRRRMELARGWKFACPCERCEKEGKDFGLVVENSKDESKVEKSMERFEANEGTL
ncbi:hypothetical protein GYMLUDRAFT_215760 [Collybiopsis luxurians FD-317 M1]|nr:hypothetical protein GYMLUDRAFT_215760 [Collybiopsis luxurians FD-317 M1]